MDEKTENIHKTLHRKLKIQRHEPQQNPGVNPGAPLMPAKHVIFPKRGSF